MHQTGSRHYPDDCLAQHGGYVSDGRYYMVCMFSRPVTLMLLFLEILVPLVEYEGSGKYVLL